MRYRLHADVVLTAGSGAKPIILVSRSSGRRVALTEEQAAIAVLLTGGADWEQLVEEARRCGLDWQGQKLHDYISRLLSEGLLTASQDVATEALDDAGDGEHDTMVSPEFLLADDDDDDGEVDDQTLVEGFDIVDERVADAHFSASRSPSPSPAAEQAESAPPTDEVPVLLPVEAPGAPQRPIGAPEAAAAIVAPEPPAAAQPPAASAEQVAEQRLLARALLLVRDGEYEAAEMALEALQQSEESPSLQTVMVLQLLRTAQMAGRAPAQQGKSRGRLLLWIVLILLVLLLSGAAALFVIKVETRREVVCRVDRKRVAAITAPIAGRVERVHVAQHAVLDKGKPALVIAARDRRAEARLRAIIASDKELLRIMRTGGKDADVRKQKKIKRDVEARLAKLKPCSDEACRHMKKDLERQREAAKTKLHFCEWQAYKREADAKAKQLAAKERQLGKLLAAQNRTVIASTRGIVTKHIAAGVVVKKGQTLVEMDDANNASAVLLIAREPPASGQLATVTLSGQGWNKRIKAKTSNESGQVSVALQLDVSKVTARTRCRADIPAPPIPLAVSLWRDLR